MHGFEFRWLLLNPLLRGLLLSVVLAAACASSLLFELAGDPPAAPSAASLAAAVPCDTDSDWPRAALRLWFLVPHLRVPGSR